MQKRAAKRKKRISLSRQMGRFLVVTFSLIIAILMIQIVILSGVYRNNLNTQIEDRLDSYAERIESANDRTNGVQGAMQVIYGSNDFERLSMYQGDNEGERWSTVWSVRSMLDPMLKGNGDIAAAYIYYGSYEKMQYCVSGQLPLSEIRELGEQGAVMGRTLNRAQTSYNFTSAVVSAAGHPYYGMLIQKNTAALAVWIDLAHGIRAEKGESWGIVRDGNYYSVTGTEPEETISFQELSEGRNQAGRYVVFARQIPSLRMTAVILMKNSLFLYVSRLELLAFVFVLCLVPVAVLLYRFARRRLITPMEDLTAAVRAINEGEWTLKFQDDGSVEEIENIRQALQTLLAEIEQYKIRIYEEKLSQQQTQLQYLRLRLTPHFYTNCLKNAYYMLELGEYDSAEKFILHMSRHMRYLLRKDVDRIPLKDELDFVENYIEMQRFLVSSPISYSAEVEDGLERAQIPILLLETFAENAVKYARDTGSGKLELSLFITGIHSEDGSYLDVGAMDNGKGYPEEILARLNRPDFQDETVTGGIRNLQNRLRIYYGDRASWYFHNAETGGAVSEIIIPLILPDDAGEGSSADRQNEGRETGRKSGAGSTEKTEEVQQRHDRTDCG